MDNEQKKSVENLISELARAIQIYRYYGSKHRATGQGIETLYDLIGQVLHEQEEIVIGIIGDDLAFENDPMIELSAKKRGFIKHLKALNVKKMKFHRGITIPEIIQFVELLSANPDDMDDEKGIRPLFESKRLQHISIGDIGLAVQEKTESKSEEKTDDLISSKSQEKLRLITQSFKDIKGDQPLNVDSAKQIVEGLMNNLFKNKNLLLLLTSMKTANESTFEHGVNVAIFSLLQAEMLGIEEKYLVDVGMAAMLHDIGKIGTSEEEQESNMVWDPKSGKQTAEMSEMQRSIEGAKILLESDEIPVLAAITAFEHDMNYDSSGPKRKLYGKELNLMSMIVCVSDYYDKLRKKPEYYEDEGPEKAYKEMMALSGKKFQPDILNNFFSVVGIYPPGTLVELDTGEMGLVIQGSLFDISRPQIELIYDSNGDRYEDPHIINLVDKDRRNKYKKSIVKSISPQGKLKQSIQSPF